MPNLTLAELRTLIDRIDDDTPQEAVAELFDRIDHAARVMREIKAAWDPVLASWLRRNGQVVIGTKRYYVGQKKKVVAGPKTAVLEALLDATQGDLAAVADTLSSQPFTHGAARVVLGDAYDEHFTELVEPTVKEGKPNDQVKCIDERFVTHKHLPSPEAR